jgi:hypothetical protein
MFIGVVFKIKVQVIGVKRQATEGFGSFGGGGAPPPPGEGGLGVGWLFAVVV